MDSATRRNSADVDHTERGLEDGELEGPFVFEYARSVFRESLAVDWPRSSAKAQKYRLTLHCRGRMWKPEQTAHQL